MQFQLAFKQLEQRKGVRSAARKARDHVVVVQATYFEHVALHDRVS